MVDPELLHGCAATALRRERLHLGMSIDDVADASGYHRNTVLAVESGAQSPGLFTAESLLGSVGLALAVVHLVPPPPKPPSAKITD